MDCIAQQPGKEIFSNDFDLKKKQTEVCKMIPDKAAKRCSFERLSTATVRGFPKMTYLYFRLH
jgi:hypothetical protein